uniref:Uncharacterized protein n=1 Tax=Molossus molossus TaxID=27622 RepID=A0A7J8JVA3_MOLMO|nr:hypothetical protein HJG59_007819 [Molossus molossus]
MVWVAAPAMSGSSCCLLLLSLQSRGLPKLLSINSSSAIIIQSACDLHRDLQTWLIGFTSPGHCLLTSFIIYYPCPSGPTPRPSGLTLHPSSLFLQTLLPGSVVPALPQVLSLRSQLKGQANPFPSSTFIITCKVSKSILFVVLLVDGQPLPVEVIPGERGPFPPCQRCTPRTSNGVRHTVICRNRFQNRENEGPSGQVPRPDFAEASCPGSRLALLARALVSECSQLVNFVFLRIQALGPSGCQQGGSVHVTFCH